MGVRLAVLAGCAAVGLASFLGGNTARAADPAKAIPTFSDVQSILNTSCVNCHNPSKKKGGVDLETLTTVMKTVEAGQPDQSKLYKSLIGAKGTKAMPPKKRLAPNEVEVVKNWIAAGAKEK